jgi:hypothetical protein
MTGQFNRAIGFAVETGATSPTSTTPLGSSRELAHHAPFWPNWPETKDREEVRMKNLFVTAAVTAAAWLAMAAWVSLAVGLAMAAAAGFPNLLADRFVGFRCAR